MDCPPCIHTRQSPHHHGVMMTGNMWLGNKKRLYRSIDLMHMTSQKGAPACWGSNEALSRAPSPSMQPAGQPLHAIPPGRPGPAHWLRGWERQRSSSTTRARSATSLDPQHGVVVMETWRLLIKINMLIMCFWTHFYNHSSNVSEFSISQKISNIKLIVFIDSILAKNYQIHCPTLLVPAKCSGSTDSFIPTDICQANYFWKHKLLDKSTGQ